MSQNILANKIKILLNIFFITGIGIGLFTRCSDDENTGISVPDARPIKPNDFLSENTYNKLVIEMTYVQGYEPTAAAVNGLKTFLESLLNKSGGITITTSSIVSPGNTTYSLSDIKKIEKIYRTRFPEDKTLAAWFFFADSDYADNEEDSKVLGIAYGPTSMAIFRKTINEFSGSFGQPSTHVLEETVIEHEFGHILGLVDNGTGMVEDHLDTGHGHHCNNEDCLMYYTVEHSRGIIGFLSGGNIPALDSQCKQDLKNNGGK